MRVRAKSEGSLPPLDLAMFRGAISSFLNFAYGEIESALDPRDEDDRWHAERSVRHLLSNPATRATLDKLLDAADLGAPTRSPAAR